VIAGAAVRRALQASADRTLIHWRDQAWTGAAIDSEVDRLTGFLKDAGPGGQVGLWYQNSVWAAIAHLAAERAGLTRVPVDPDAPADEARAIWTAAGVDLVVGDSAHVAGLAGAVAYDEGHGPAPGGPPGSVEVAGDTTHLLFPRTVSSGGLLAIPISYRGWEAHMATNSRLFREGGYGPPVDASDTLLTVQQMMHGTGLVATFPFLLMGIPQVVVDRFDVTVVAEAADRHRITSAFMVPGMVTRLAEWAEVNGSLPFRRIVYGGAPITPTELRHALAHLGPVLTQIYGRLEGGWPLTVLGAEEHQRIADGDNTLLDSCGRAVPEVELETRPVGDPRAHGGGELRVRGAMTSPAFTDPDGWCSLGDLATVDDDGYVRLHGRVDGMINTGSYHVYPQEVEEAIRELPQVLDVTVSGVADERWGEAVLASITWPSGHRPPDDGELRTSLRTRLARYKVPTRFSHHHDGSADGEPRSR
jgi:acyl-CoA synthetase (AMP-forming)/AMP-acid ligase II